ncbi:hypothetical protein HMPREF9161_00891 [Selenomonas sp. F0473]|nr:hypothetical protein HMPREF9161_00891 [Selenomonas sp. F0473]
MTVNEKVYLTYMLIWYMMTEIQSYNTHKKSMFCF